MKIRLMRAAKETSKFHKCSTFITSRRRYCRYGVKHYNQSIIHSHTEIKARLLFFFTECYSLTQGNSLYRSCSSGYFLQITYARYYHSACTNQADVTSRINSMCNYPSACTIYADNSWLGGNPCVGYTKTLVWTDSCNGK